MRNAVLIGLLCLAAGPAFARDQEAEQSRPVTDQSVNAEDVATTPVSDLNLRKDEIPKLLLDAQQRPYDVTGLSRCPDIAARVRELDAVLGEDFDLPQGRANGMSAGRVAQSVVGSFIPFRGVIREVSGANSHERKMAAAIDAGIARRAFLKGYGEGKRCAYPARAARPADIAALARQNGADAAAAPKQERKRSGKKGAASVSRPVVQPTD